MKVFSLYFGGWSKWLVSSAVGVWVVFWDEVLEQCLGRSEQEV